MTRLSQLAVSAEGFVFDPTSGESYTVNSSGLLILNGLRENKSPEVIAQELAVDYEVTLEEVEKDILDFRCHLRTYKLL